MISTEQNQPSQHRLLLSMRALLASQPHLTFIVISLNIVIGLLPAAFALATGTLIQILPEASGATFGSSRGKPIVSVLAIIAALLIAQSVLVTIENVVRSLLHGRFSRDIRSRALAAVQRPPGISHLEMPATLDTLTLVVRENMKWEAGDFVGGGAIILARFTQGLVAAFLVASFSWWAALLLMATWIAARRSALRIITAGLFEGLSALRQAYYLKDLATRPIEAKEVRLFGLHEWLLGRYTAVWTVAVEHLWRAQRGARIKTVIWLGAVTIVHAIVFIVIAYTAASGQMSLGSVAVVVQAIFAIAALGDVGSAETLLENGLHVIPPVLALEQALAQETETLDGDGQARGLPVMAIRFEDVHFRYPGRTAKTLDGFTLEIQAGQSLAIVGENGAGKTTIAKLLARLYTPDDGRIMVDQHDLRTIDPVAWRRCLAVIFQDFVRYEMSVADNVGYGALDHRNDTEALRRAAARAGALSLIEHLPHQWETILSRRYKHGVELSGGQWQRIALARAFFSVEAGASVLLLDEPTAALDVRAEAELFDHFLELTRGLTTILVSHRFSTVRRADRIVVIENGQVAEEGTHNELMTMGKRYARMFALQANRFDSSLAPEMGDGQND